MEKKILFVLLVVALFASSLQQQQQQSGKKVRATTTPGPRDDVANQSNLDGFVRRKNEPFEGEDDIEFTESDLRALIKPIIPWSKKSNNFQVPYVIDINANFPLNDVEIIINDLNRSAEKMKVKFKQAQRETYSLKISSINQCAQYKVQKFDQPFNEILVCLDGENNYHEILRAIKLGSAINEKFVSSSEEQDDDYNRQNNQQERNDEIQEKVEQQGNVIQTRGGWDEPENREQNVQKNVIQRGDENLQPNREQGIVFPNAYQGNMFLDRHQVSVHREIPQKNLLQNRGQWVFPQNNGQWNANRNQENVHQGNVQNRGLWNEPQNRNQENVHQGNVQNRWLWNEPQNRNQENVHQGNVQNRWLWNEPQNRNQENVRQGNLNQNRAQQNVNQEREQKPTEVNTRRPLVNRNDGGEVQYYYIVY